MNIIKRFTIDGKKLVGLARKVVEQQQQQEVVLEVSQMVRAIGECQRTLEHTKRCLKFYENKLQALEAGEFSVDDRFQMKIQYNDKRFNCQGVPQSELEGL